MFIYEATACSFINYFQAGEWHRSSRPTLSKKVKTYSQNIKLLGFLRLLKSYRLRMASL